MNALLFYGNRDLRFDTLKRPEPGAGEVLINITDAGLSQATVAEFIEGPFVGNVDPHPRTGIALPFIPCQEFGGNVDSVGEGVSDTLIGKTGAVLPALPCGTCTHCEGGRHNLCESLAYRGILGAHGGFTEQIVISENDFFPTTENIPPNLVEPLLVATHAVSQLRTLGHSTELNTPILIMGAGCIGICLATILRDIYGADVSITDPLEQRLERAADAGFNTIAFSAIDETNGSWPVVVDAAGKDASLSKQPLDQALDLCAAGGTILGIGTYFITLEILPARFLFQEQQVVPSFAYCSADVEELSRIQSSLTTNFHSLMTPVPFDQIIDDGYYLAELDRNAFTRITTSPYRTAEARIAA